MPLDLNLGGAGAGIGEKMGGLAQGLLKGGLIFLLVVILAGAILGIGLYIRYVRQFNVKCRIKTVRGSGADGKPIYKIINDLGGFIHRKSDGARYFKLLKERVKLPLPPLECLQIGADGKNYLDILQLSETEYYFITPSNIELGTVIRDGKEIPLADANVKVIDSGSGYWNLVSKRDIKKTFSTESVLMKLLPYIVPVLMFMLVIFMTYLITSHWGDFAAAAEALRNAAEALRDTTTAEVAYG